MIDKLIKFSEVLTKIWVDKQNKNQDQILEPCKWKLGRSTMIKISKPKYDKLDLPWQLRLQDSLHYSTAQKVYNMVVQVEYISTYEVYIWYSCLKCWYILHFGLLRSTWAIFGLFSLFFGRIQVNYMLMGLIIKTKNFSFLCTAQLMIQKSV